jgi:hypothetical protein
MNGHQGDTTSLLLFFQNKGNRVKIGIDHNSVWTICVCV